MLTNGDVTPFMSSSNKTPLALNFSPFHMVIEAHFWPNSQSSSTPPPLSLSLSLKDSLSGFSCFIAL